MSDTFGRSAGRSAKNPVKPTARRRNSEAEREQRMHLHDDPAQWPTPRRKNDIVLTRRGVIALGVAMFGVSLVVTWLLRDFCWYGPCPWTP